ncbi:MAG TPA: heme o synthase [Verrucomicrobiae bacterium]|nr:heme o synthase [Verrucomicrobiae bacterium]
MLRKYYAALKPERTYANVMTTGAGFLLACKWHIHWGLLVATIAGTTAVVMSACGVNNCTDRGIDARMPRTKRRATVTGDVPIRRLAILSIVLGIVGFGILIWWVNWLVVLLGAVGYLDYVVLYGWTKRTTPWSTWVGTVSGAVPIAAGYVAVSDRLDTTALALALVMLFWQMPHFYAIGIFRRKDYKSGGLPIWPVRYGVKNTQVWIIICTILYLYAVLWLAVVGSLGFIFGLVMGMMGVYWIGRGLRGFRSQDPEKWARGMFGLSLVVLLVLAAGIALAPVLPI